MSEQSIGGAAVCSAEGAAVWSAGGAVVCSADGGVICSEAEDQACLRTTQTTALGTVLAPSITLVARALVIQDSINGVARFILPEARCPECGAMWSADEAGEGC